MTEQNQTGFRRKPEPDNRITKVIQRRLYVRAYNLFDLRKRYAGRWRRSLVLLLLQATLVMMPYVILHPKLGGRSIALIALAVLLSNLFLRFEVNAVQTQKIGESKNERKIRTSAILDEIAVRFSVISMTGYELQQLRQEILLAITSSVASSLGMDSTGFMASLVIKTPSAPDRSLTVVARSSNSREIGLVYPREGMLAWDAIERKQVQVTGDVSEEYDGFESKPYKSVVSFPITTREGTCIAAVNIDHAFRFLFVDRGLLFQTNLRPYLRLIALSLTNIASAQPEPTVTA